MIVIKLSAILVLACVIKAEVIKPCKPIKNIFWIIFQSKYFSFLAIEYKYKVKVSFGEGVDSHGSAFSVRSRYFLENFPIEYPFEYELHSEVQRRTIEHLSTPIKFNWIHSSDQNKTIKVEDIEIIEDATFNYKLLSRSKVKFYSNDSNEIPQKTRITFYPDINVAIPECVLNVTLAFDHDTSGYDFNIDIEMRLSDTFDPFHGFGYTLQNIWKTKSTPISEQLSVFPFSIENILDAEEIKLSWKW